MEDMWNLRSCMTRSSGQPSPGSSTLNQFDMNPGQLSQPYVAQEVCVIERTIRQEPVGPNLMTFGQQGLSPNKVRSELLALVSGVQQHPHRPSYPPSISARSTYIASHPQFSHMNPTDSAGFGGWSTMSPPNLLQTNRVDGNGNPNSGADTSRSGQGRDASGMSGGRVHENFSSNGLRTPDSELLKQSSGFTRGTQEQGVDGSRQSPSPQWLTEIVRRRQQFQSVQASTLFSANSDLHRTESTTPNIGAGVPNQSPSVARPAPSGRLRVFCPNYAGVTHGGELCLTDAGRLGVICTCHNAHMSVAKFTQHAGVYTPNPGEAVLVEGGETLVQWRKTFFTQYGVKVPEDSVGWEWLDVDAVETGQGKYKAVMTQSWQKEVDVSYGGNTPMVKSRTTQVWDASLANGTNPKVHATQSVSNTKYAPLNTGQGGMQDSRDPLFKSFGSGYRGGTLVSDYGSSQFFSEHQNQRNQGSTGTSTSFYSSHLGDMPMSNEYNFINDGGQRYLSPGQRATGALRNVKELNYPLNRWSVGQELLMKEKDNSSSSFELRLGQPSQQTQPAGASFPSMPASNVEHPKSHLFEQIMSRVWDGKLQPDLQQFNPAELPRFSGNPGQAREQPAATTSQQPAYGRSFMETPHTEGQSSKKGRSSPNSASMQSTRRMANPMQSASNPDATEEHLQARFPMLDCGPQSNKLSRSGDCRVQNDQSVLDKSVLKFVPHTDQLRSVTLENGTTLDSLSTGALVHLSNKTGHRLLETAIQSSFGYQAMGLEAPSAKSTDAMSRRCIDEILPSDLGYYGRPFLPSRGSLPNFAVRNDVQNDAVINPHRGLDSANAAQLQQSENGAIYMREQGGGLMSHHSVHKSSLECGSSIHDGLRGRKGVQPSSEELQDWSGNMNGKHWEVQEQPPLIDKQTWFQRGPESDNIVASGLGSKLKTSRVQSSGLSEGQGGSKASGAGPDEFHSQPLPDLPPRDTKIGEEHDVVEVDPDSPTENREDIHCNCYQCRKSSPLARGRAVPRLAGQVCLKEKGGNGTKMEPAKKKTPVDIPQKPSNKCLSPHKQQKSTEPQSDMIPGKTGKEGKCTRDLSSQPLIWEDVQDLSEERSEQRDTAGESEPLITGNEDLLSDTAAKGTPPVASSSRTPKALSDVCSKSSENVLSGLSDEGCDNDGGGGNLLAQPIGKIPGAGALDEGSGIGKCSSSDGVDMGAATNPHPVSTLEDPSKRDSPSSLRCPSSSNVAKRLIVKRNGPRATGGWHVSKEPEQNDEPEPVSTAGKLEKKGRRIMKWKRLDSDVSAGEAKKGKLLTSSGQIAGPKVPVEKPEVGIKVQKAEVRPDQGVRDRGLPLEVPAEKEQPIKRRRVAPASDNPSVPEAKETEVTEEIRTSEEDGEQRKVRTLVIRVPQGVNRQKAKRAIRTNLNPHKTVTDFRPDVREEARLPSREGPVLTNLTSTKGGQVNRNPGSYGDTVSLPPEVAPGLLTTNLWSVRTPLGGPSPRNGRMVSLSDIMKQPAERWTHPEVKEGPKEVLKLKADMPKLKEDVSREGKTRKKVDASLAFVAITPDQFNEVKDFALPEMEPSWRGEKKIRVLHKEDARKVRSLWELTGKNNMPGPGAEVFDFAEEVMDSLKAGKQGTRTVQTDTPPPKAGAGFLIERSCPFPRSGRSARSIPPNKRNVEWHRSKDAQVDTGKSDGEAAEEEKVFPQINRNVLCDSSQSSAARTRIPRLDMDQTSPYQATPVRKQVRSSKLKECKVFLQRLQAKDGIADGRAQMKDKPAETKPAKDVLVKTTFAQSWLPKRPSDSPDMIEISAKRLKVIGGFKKVKDKAEGVTDKARESYRGAFSPDKEVTFKRVVHDPPVGKVKLLKKGKSPAFKEEEKLSVRKKKKSVGGSDCNQSGQPEKSKCDVCGSSASVSYNKLLCCGRCPVKVHQACYGVPKIPKGPWSCRTCKFTVTNPVCVLCGYGGGAMTRVQKSRGFVQGLLQAWRDLDNEKEILPSKSHSDEEDDDETLLSATISLQSSKNSLSVGLADKLAKNRGKTGNYCEPCSCGKSGKSGSFCKACMREHSKAWGTAGEYMEQPSSAGTEKLPQEDWRSNNTITAIVKDAGAKQWAHMVCTLWMPGTRCLNMGTMGVFDVSGVTVSRRKSLCSICQRKGGACIQCRVPKCSTPFHVWCAHEKGLLQSETVRDGTNQVGFFGKCQHHGNCSGSELEDSTVEDTCRPATSGETCARTEGYKGRQTLAERAKSRQQMTLEGSMAVTPEQVAAWLRINDRKSSTRRFIKPANSVMKYDHREYLRFKQKKGWRRLAVYKSGIHALGLYTMEFIAEGEVVVEYIGEIVGLRVADKREAEYHSGKRLQYQGACYLFRIDTEQIIDATRKGGIARFVNHSCSPNCVAKVICVDNLKKVIFFAKRDIYAGEEVTYDYKFNYDEVGDKIPCFCGSSDCRGTLN